VTKIVDYDYAVNDYYGNEQMRQEHVEPGKQVGHWSARMADGAMETVSYEAGPYGNLEHIVIRSNDYAAPVHSYAAPRTPTRGELNRVLHSGRGYTRSGQGAGQTRASRTRLPDQPGAGNQLVGESKHL